MKYSADDIKVDNFPKIKEFSNGEREQIWNIVLRKPISQKTDLQFVSEKLSHEDFVVNLVGKGNCLTVCLKTIRDPNPYIHDPNLFSIYKLFDDIEKLLGDIDTIEDQKSEDRWSPYKKT